MFSRTDEYIEHLLDEIDHLRKQVEHERDRAERAIDQLLIVRTPAAPVSAPHISEPTANIVERLLQDSEWAGAGDATG